MKRKIMKIADTTYVVSLPLKWARKYGIKKGDEIDLEEKGNKLVFKVKNSDSTKKEGIFEAHKFGPIVKRSFDAMYKAGYDKIIVNYKTKYEINEIQDAINLEAMTFEIVKQTKDNCVISSITEGTDEEFDSLLRRTFLLLKVMGEDLKIAIEKKDYESIEYIKNLEKTNNKLTHFLRRSVAKRGYKNPDKSVFVYTIIEQLETVADEFRDLCNFLIDKRNRDMIITNDTFELLDLLNGSLNIFTKIFYDFSETEAVKFYQLKKELVTKGLDLFQVKSTKEIVVIHYIIHLPFLHIFSYYNTKM